MKNIVVIGSGGHGKVILDILEKQGIYNILGTIDDNKEKGTTAWQDYKVIGNLSTIRGIQNLYGGIIAIGDNWIRSQVAKKIISEYPNFNFVNAVHPSSSMAKDVKMGDGNVIMANTSINSSTEIGDHCIINTSSSVDHDNTLENYVTISPGAITGGNVKIGEYSTVSLGANIIHGIEIGKHTVIGAGSTVVNNIQSFVIAYGVPAKIIRERKIGERYL